MTITKPNMNPFANILEIFNHEIYKYNFVIIYYIILT